jgi:protein-tyrosine-phosphatase/predicted ATP-grasp superfamily ATP-dependent carboligase
VLTAIVLDADSVAGLEALQSLGRSGVVAHAAANVDCLAFRSRRVSMSWKQPPKHERAEFVRWLRDLNERYDYALIIPSTEPSLLILLSLDDDDPLVRRAAIAPRASMEVALDKWATVELARLCGVPTPPTRLVTSPSDLSEAQSYPLVIKSLRSVVDVDGSMTTMHTRLVQDSEERDRYCRALLPHTPVIEQRYLGGIGFGVELLYDRGKRIWHFCHLRVHEGTGQEGLGSGSLYRRSATPPPDLLQHATCMLDRLCWHGVAMVEFLVSPSGESWLMEINPRLWGSLALAIDAGIDFPVGLSHLACRQEVPVQPTYRVPYYTRRVPEDIFWMLRKARTRPFWAAREFFLMSRLLAGRESWDHFDWGDLRVTLAKFSSFLGKLASFIGRRFGDRLAWRGAARLHRSNLRALLAPGRPIRSVLFLCRGNICRSPVADALARRLLPGCAIASAGFVTEPNRPSPSNAKEAARLLGIDLADWRSHHVSGQMVESADIVFVMDMRNLRAFQEAFPGDVGKVLFLGMFLPGPAEIADPYGANVEKTIVVLRSIQEAMDRFARLFAARAGG